MTADGTCTAGASSRFAVNNDSSSFLDTKRLVVAWRCYRNFEDFSFEDVTQNEDLDPEKEKKLEKLGLRADKFVLDFEKKAAEVLEAGCAYTDTLLAFKLLDKCHMLTASETEHFLAMASSELLRNCHPDDVEQEECNRKNKPNSLHFNNKRHKESLFSLCKTYVRSILISEDFSKFDDVSSMIKVDESDLVEEASLSLNVPEDDYYYETEASKNRDLLAENIDFVFEEKQKKANEPPKLPPTRATDDLQTNISSNKNIVRTNLELDVANLNCHALVSSSTYGRKINAAFHQQNEKYDLSVDDTQDNKEKLISLNQFVKDNLMCKECNVVYKTEQCFFDHIEKVHKTQNCDSSKTESSSRKMSDRKNVNSCVDCNENFATKKQLNQHRKQAHGSVLKAKSKVLEIKALAKDNNEKEKNAANCDICGANFASAIRLSQHKVDCHQGAASQSKDRKFNCDQCGQMFTLMKNLRAHVKVKHEGVRYPCDECGKMLTTTTHLRKHKRMVHQGVRYLCKECPKRFANKCYLIRHEKTVHNHEVLDRPELCDKCGHKARNRSALKQHKRRVHDYKSLFSCGQCDYAGKDNTELKAHVAIKHEGKKLQCNKCDYAAASLGSLYRHRFIKHRAVDGSTENEDPMASCPDCSYVAKSRLMLRQHQKVVHEKRYQSPCNQCDYVAPNSTVLKVHVLSKHQGVTFPCSQCDFVAPHPKSLKRHKDIHHDMKRYYCDQCDYMAKDKQLVTIHKQTKHECIQFACDMCEIKFATQPLLKKHKKAKH